MLRWKSKRGPATWGPQVSQRHLRETDVGGGQGQCIKSLLSSVKEFELLWDDGKLVKSGQGADVTVAALWTTAGGREQMDHWMGEHETHWRLDRVGRDGDGERRTEMGNGWGGFWHVGC